MCLISRATPNQVCDISRQTVKAHFRKLAASQRIFLQGVHAKESKQAGKRGGGGTIGRSAGGTDIGLEYRAWAGDVAGSGSSSSEEEEGGSDASAEGQPLLSPSSASPLLDRAERQRARQLAELKKLLGPDGALKLQQQQQQGASEGDVGERLLNQMQVTGIYPCSAFLRHPPAGDWATQQLSLLCLLLASSLCWWWAT